MNPKAQPSLPLESTPPASPEQSPLRASPTQSPQATAPEQSPLPLGDGAPSASPQGLPLIALAQTPQPDAVPFLQSKSTLFLAVGVAACLAAAYVAFRLFFKKGRAGVVTMTQTQGSGPRLLVGNLHNVGQRKNQQDAFGVSNVSNAELVAAKGVFAVLADGMGGLSNGAQMSALITRSMLRYFTQATFRSDASIELLNMLTAANREANAYIAQNANQHCGSTVVAAIIRDGLLHFISVGDSRICLLRNNRLIQINREHTYASELDEKAARGEITFEEAANDPQRAAITSFIGMGELAKIDRNSNPIHLMNGDRILLMSDGVFGTLSDEEIIAAMQADIHETTSRLEAAVLQKRKQHQDNFTAIVLEVAQ